MDVITVTEKAPVAVVLCSVLVAVTALLKHHKISIVSFLLDFITIPLRLLRNRLSAWMFLFHGPDIIQDAYDKSNGRPFELFAPDNRLIFVSSPGQIKELDHAPDTVLSLQAASKQMLQPMHSMHGFNWFDRRGTEGVGFIRALRTLLTNHLPKILPDLRAVLTNRMTDEISNVMSEKALSEVRVYPLVVKLVVLANSYSFFGKELVRNEEFMIAALSYVEETLLVAEIIRLLPRFMHLAVGRLLKHRVASSQKIVYDTLMQTAEERVRERDLGFKRKEHNDCIQWIMETSPKQKPWSAQRIVFELMAIWFGSVHAMSTTITFTVQDLCIHPEYVLPLREEFESSEYATFEKTARGLPLLDSFVKESARLTPVESLSTRRQAIQPFTLSDGTHLSIGDWACTPVRALMQDERHYPDPLEFSGFRFAHPSLYSQPKGVRQPEPSKLTDVGSDFHVWGTGRMACPGRYYAAAIMKIVVAQIVLRYDFELVDKSARRWWTWRSSMLPIEKTLVVFKPRLIN